MERRPAPAPDFLSDGQIRARSPMAMSASHNAMTVDSVASGRRFRHTHRRHRVPLVLLATLLAVQSQRAQAMPDIRLHERNQVPACVSPDRLMTFLKSRNPRLNARYRDIARHYAYWGEAWRVRWDYAFYQMIIETNALSFRRPDGRRGDVREDQNNFAGIGATGGGVRGDRFADVSSGVHAQIQHLVAYAGVRVRDPVADRTRKVQDHIVELSLRLGRPVTFSDLARRWAVDPKYGRSIEFIADQYQKRYCVGTTAAADPAISVPNPKPAFGRRWSRFDKPSGLGGPRPRFLAGPDEETLPWAATVAPPAGGAKSKLPHQADTRPNHPDKRPKSFPVRTIWTRQSGGVAARMDDGAETFADTAPVTATVNAGTRSVAIADGQGDASTDVKKDEGFFLPLFRIAPAQPEPSRLGGPVPAAPQAPIGEARNCRVLSASYGGKRTLLLQSELDGELRLTALTVLEGFEKTMFETYVRAAAPGAEIVGDYDSPEAAIADAQTNCASRTATR